MYNVITKIIMQLFHVPAGELVAFLLLVIALILIFR